MRTRVAFLLTAAAVTVSAVLSAPPCGATSCNVNSPNPDCDPSTPVDPYLHRGTAFDPDLQRGPAPPPAHGAASSGGETPGNSQLAPQDISRAPPMRR